VLKFDDCKVVRSEVNDFVALERQCCGFLNFTISSPEEVLSLSITGPDGSQDTIKAWINGAGAA